MAILLPEPIAGYFAADRNADHGSITRYFSEAAIVVDEGKSHVGHEAIQTWMAESVAKFTYVAEPFEVATQAGQTVVTAHLEGNFPGSPVDLRYRFMLDGDQITRLEIGL
jgi:hypothetical protein